ncbi:ATP-binding protein [Pseudomonas syringae]|uniref:ATP-binding protein n=1 Tax=Pseudomonas syringae TaxID=317 RepID=UPI001BCBF944|nr:ATP-binding protein [Pseudomonas syringae]MBS7413371.1 ATP-binding protein [Pseudomonas syringae]
MAKVEVKAKGIKNRLKAIKPYRAVAEYIWNGFDAGATSVDVRYEVDDLGGVKYLAVQDNGSGIPHLQVENKFKPILSSEKRDLEVQHSLVHGKNGLGRLTFFHFAQRAIWRTRYASGDEVYEYEIKVSDDDIDSYSFSSEENVSGREVGTCVSFENIIGLSESYIKNELTSYLKDFAWLLELKRDQGFAIRINGADIPCESLVRDSEKFTLNIADHLFDVKFVRWSRKLNRHFSRFYCSDLVGGFKYSRPTTLNNKGDEFYHSVFVVSDYFKDFSVGKEGGQIDLLSSRTDQSEEFKELIKSINLFLRSKRKPFIVDHAKKLVEEFEAKGYFPDFNSKNNWELARHEDLKEIITQLYQVEPKIFSNLNPTQKMTFIRFISLIVDSGEVEDLFKILDGVVDLSSGERERFARQLQTTKMSSIVNTIELISDRYKSVAEFKKLVFDPNMYAGEVPHLQKMMEKNYWLIGEEYQLLTAAEPKFEEALRRYTYLLHGIDSKGAVDHESKNREMDLFLVRQGKKQSIVENIVLELKHPTNIRLGKKEFDQVYDYYQVIRSIDQFNGSNMDWKFYLIGNQFDSSGYIESQIKSHKNHGEPGLMFIGEYRVYAFRWSEIFTEFELKHDFLNKNLQLELERLTDGRHDSADDIVAAVRTSDAPKEMVA